ncbi:MAG: hypothetical protein P1P76_10900 [Anaerolineales bacterium]|nr:hypothetical protein [Anaerolineales bacterium]
MLATWMQFFDLYPDYMNHFGHVEVRGDLVLLAGLSTCSFAALDDPSLWTAKVEDGLIMQWRVYLDTPDNRRLLDLSP